MEAVSFKLLLADGAVNVTFEPPLRPADYEYLLALVTLVRNARELEIALYRLAPLWGVEEFRIEPA